MPATDPFDGYANSITAPANRAISISPDDGNDLSFVARGLYVGGTGDIAVTTLGGDSVTFTSVPAGTILPVRVSRVLSTGTTATNLLGLH